MEPNGNKLMSITVQPLPTDNTAETLVPTYTSSVTSYQKDRLSFFLIDQDTKIRQLVHETVGDAGHRCVEFDALDRFQALVTYEPHGAILSEFRAETERDLPPGAPPVGIRLLQYLRTKRWECPVIFVSNSEDISDCAKAFRAGATAFIKKATLQEELRANLELISSVCSERKNRLIKQREVAEKLNLLTSREREVLDQLVAGQSMKAIASNSGTSFQAVARHRQRILEKLSLEGDVALVRWFFNLSPG